VADTRAIATPRFWRNPHLQTLYGPLRRKLAPLALRRERLWLDDGDFLDLDWHGPASADAPLVLVLHGLTGSSRSHYVAGLQKQLSARQWASVALNWRGCSGEPNLLPRSYHSGSSADLAEVIGQLQARYPGRPLYAVGYSLGGNILLKHLGESGAGSLLRGAVAVSVPFRLDQCADRIGMGFSRVYQAHFLRQMLAYVQLKQERFRQEGHQQHLDTLLALGKIDTLRTFWAFDDQVTAPLNGFAGVEDYYRQASSAFYLSGIRVPTLIIQALDDPFVFAHSIPTAETLSPSTCLEVHAHGGHVGFIEGRLRAPAFYLEARIPAWLQATHERSVIHSLHEPAYSGASG
jgi:predicted alpha/beta-fold hydrolase